MENKLNLILANQGTIISLISNSNLNIDIDVLNIAEKQMDKIVEILKPSSADEESKALKDEPAKEIAVKDAKTEESV